MRKLLYLIIAFALLASGNEAYAQMNRRAIKKNNKRISSFRGRKAWFGKEKRYDAIGFGVNALNYYGDLSPKPSIFSTDIKFTRPAFAISWSHRFGPRYTLMASFMYGTLKGSDSKSADERDTDNGLQRYQRNLSFRNRVKELSVVAMFDLFENQSTYISRVKWTPYLFAGIAVFTNNPQAQAPATDLQGNPLAGGGKWVDLQPLGTEGQYSVLQPGDANNGIKPYHKIQPSIPIGIGARFRINEVMDFSAEIGFRYTFTDYLDDVSKSYVDLGVFGNNELAKAMSYRSNEIDPATLKDPSYETYTGRDGQSYTVLAGYGNEKTYASGDTNVRGNKKNKDMYMVTTFRLTYIIGKTFHRAKFR
jgi:hypothetical protein